MRMGLVVHPIDLIFTCSECGERLEVIDIWDEDDIIYIKPCEGCLDEKGREE